MTELDKAAPPPPTQVQYGPIQDVKETPKKTGFGRLESDQDSEELGLPIEETTPPPEPSAEQPPPAEPPKPSEQEQAEQRIKDAQAKMHEATQEKAAWQKLAQELIQARPMPIPSAQAEPVIPEQPLPDPSLDPQAYAEAIERRVEYKLQSQQRVEKTQRMFDEFVEKHPDWEQKLPELRVAERQILSNPLEAAYKIVSLAERQKGEQLADQDFEESKKDFRTAIAMQEAEKSKQTIPQSAASPIKSPIPDFNKMTADEAWEWVRAHPDKSGVPSRRWGQIP